MSTYDTATRMYTRMYTRSAVVCIILTYYCSIDHVIIGQVFGNLYTSLLYSITCNLSA